MLKGDVRHEYVGRLLLLLGLAYDEYLACDEVILCVGGFVVCLLLLAAALAYAALALSLALEYNEYLCDGVILC